TTGGGSLLLSSSTLAATSDHLLVETGSIQRKYWISVLQKTATPVLESLSRCELRRTMPVETAGSAEKLKRYTHLEAISRLLVGLGPWLQLEGLSGEEQRLQQEFSKLARECLDA